MTNWDKQPDTITNYLQMARARQTQPDSKVSIKSAKHLDCEETLYFQRLTVEPTE